MGLPATLSVPKPVSLSVLTSLPPSEALARLEVAMSDRRYSTPGRLSRAYFRLGGSATDGRLIVKARPYVTPGIPAGYGAMTLELRGGVAPTPEGSEIRGVVTAPIGTSTVAVLALVAVAWSLVVVGSNGASWPALLFAFAGVSAMSVAWVWAARHNQRRALANTAELGELLKTALS